MTNPSAQTMLELDNLVSSLRQQHKNWGYEHTICGRAADAIEQLRAASAPAAVREALQDQVNRIHGAISDYSDMSPESDETWESWYRAAFDLLSQKVKIASDKIMSAALATPEEASTAVGEAVARPAETAMSAQGALEIAANIAESIDSGRGNEKIIAKAIRDVAKRGYWTRPDIAAAPPAAQTDGEKSS